MWRGSFPAVALHNELDWNLFYSSYVQTYIQRDIRDLAKVGDEMAFLRFLRACAARTGQLLNMSELARDADISSNTAKNWLSLLQASGIIYPLELKKMASPSKKEAQNFHLLEKLRLPLGPGGVISLAEQFLPLTSAVNAIPAKAI